MDQVMVRWYSSISSSETAREYQPPEAGAARFLIYRECGRSGAMNTAITELEGAAFGGERYTRVDGQRCRIELRRSIQPYAGETNEAFEARMETMVDRLYRDPIVTEVVTDYERRRGAYTACVITVRHAPKLVELTADQRPAGGRLEAGRGHRGAGRHVA